MHVHDFLAGHAPLTLSTWLDDGPKVVLQDEYLERVSALPFKELAVMVDGPKPGLEEARWNAANLAKLRAAFPTRDLILTIWTPAIRHSLRELEAKIVELASALGAVAIEADAEPAGKWAKKFVVGYPSLAAAAEDAMRIMRLPGLRTEVTVFPAAFGSAAELVKRADVLVSQNYAVATHDGVAVMADGKHGPERYPKESIQEARHRFPLQKIVSGHAAYHQRFKTLAPDDAMRTAIKSAVGAGCNNIRFWAGKHFFRFKHSYAIEVLHELIPYAVL